MTTKILCFIFLMSSYYNFAQTDTSYFDAAWKPSSKNIHTYYRVTSVEDGLIYIGDYYKNGVKQMTGTMRYTKDHYEKVSESQDAKGNEVGKFKWYNQDGSVYYMVTYQPDVNKYMDSLQLSIVNVDSLKLETTFFAKGGINEEGIVLSNGNYHGEWSTYSKKGALLETVNYRNGLKHGWERTYDSKGNIKKRNFYHKGKLMKKEPDK